MAALDCLRERLPLAMQDVRRGLAEVSLPGRFQVLPGRPQVVLDVAHNPEAAAVLAANLGDSGFARRRLRYSACSGTRTSPGSLRAWRRASTLAFGDVAGSRGADAGLLEIILQEKFKCRCARTQRCRRRWRRGRSGENDKIVVFGSFLTVAMPMAESKTSTC
jgi:dihydrofolate synthase/folylpolyglutamate synthase